MDEQPPHFDLPPDSDDSNFPWLGVVVAIVLIGGAAWWFFSGKTAVPGHETATTALEQQLDKDRAELDAERAKSVAITQQMEALHQAINLGKVPNKRQAMADYTNLNTEHEVQRAKVKTLSDQFHQKLANLQKLQ